MHKVLMVEDDEDIQAMWKDMWDMLADGRQKETQFVSAFTLEEAKAVFFTAESGFTAIVMDACVQGNKPNTPSLVRKMRTVFTGPIIAISSDPDYQCMLMAAGCSHRCEKLDLPDTLFRILGL